MLSNGVCWQRELKSGDCYADKSSSLLANADKADGFVIISPEWAGMVPPCLKTCSCSLALSRMVSIHEYVLVQDVADVLAGETPASDRDAWLRRRIEFADRILLDYAKALIPIRSSGLTEHGDFPSGMRRLEIGLRRRNPFVRNGVPDQVGSDNGREFTAKGCGSGSSGSG